MAPLSQVKGLPSVSPRQATTVRAVEQAAGRREACAVANATLVKFVMASGRGRAAIRVRLSAWLTIGWPAELLELFQSPQHGRSTTRLKWVDYSTKSVDYATDYST